MASAALAPINDNEDTQAETAALMAASVQHILDNSEVKNSGVRVVSSKGYYSGIEERHNVTRDEIRRVQDAVDHENTAAARVALGDLEEKLAGATDADLESEDYRKNMRSTVRLPTHTGSTEVTVRAESHTNTARKAGDDTEGPTTQVSYGVVDTSISAKSRIHTDFHAEAQERMRKALRVKD